MVDAAASGGGRRVWAAAPEAVNEALASLTGSDLQTLLLAVARHRGGQGPPG